MITNVVTECSSDDSVRRQRRVRTAVVAEAQLGGGPTTDRPCTGTCDDHATLNANPWRYRRRSRPHCRPAEQALSMYRTSTVTLCYGR